MAAVTSREPSAAPYSPGSTIDDPELVQKSQTVDSENESSLPPAQTSALDGSASPPGSGSKFPAQEVRGRRGRFEKKTRRSKGTPKGAAHLWIQEGPHEGTEDDGSVVSSSAYQKSGWTQRRSHSPRTSDVDIRHTVGTAVGTRRQANGTVGTVYSGSKIRHIKKDDGTPLWRKDIQYEFLRTVVEDKTPVFTRISDGQKNCNFADIYIDAMARSSKTSKALKDRLHTDREAAQNMAMICLLVNVGRMNTTLNFFPEMRAQLRTYHSIPSLQANKSQRDYKSLQDAPRLKSILKGASEDNPEEPRTVPGIMAASIPRTNPVNLIFTLSQYAPKVSETHFIASVDFFDLVIRHTLSSASRARAFLWLMWWYLESDFSAEASLSNPFGPGEIDSSDGNSAEGTIPLKVPKLEEITDEQGNAENLDPEEEKVFAEKMQKERKRLLETEPSAGGIGDPESKLVQRWRKLTGGPTASSMGSEEADNPFSDVDSARGASPAVPRAGSGTPATGGVAGIIHPPLLASGQGQAESLDDEWEPVDPHPGRGRYKRTKANTAKRRKRIGEDVPVMSSSGRILKQTRRAEGTPFSELEGMGTPAPVAPVSVERRRQVRDREREEDGGLGMKIVMDGRSGDVAGGGSGGGKGGRRARPLTQHQRALEEHKRDRVEWVLRGWKHGVYEKARRRREQMPFIVRVAMRLQNLPVGYDSEDEEDGAWGWGGLLGKRSIGKRNDVDGEEKENEGKTIVEEDDFGEEAEMWAKVFKRTIKRVQRWDGLARTTIKKGNGGKKRRRVLQSQNAVGFDGDGDVLMQEQDGNREGGGTTSSPPPSNAHELAGLDEIDQSLLAERSDEDENMADDDGSADEEDGDGESDR